MCLSEWWWVVWWWGGWGGGTAENKTLVILSRTGTGSWTGTRTLTRDRGPGVFSAVGGGGGRILREYVQRMHSFRNAASINPRRVCVDVSAGCGMLRVMHTIPPQRDASA